MRKFLVRILVIVAALALLAGAAYWLRTQSAGKQADGAFTPLATLAAAAGATSLGATPDGNTLVYLDNTSGALQLADIADPLAPAPMASVPLPGSPTGVAISSDGNTALATLFFGDTQGAAPHPWLPGGLAIIDISNRTKPVLTEIIGIGHHPVDVVVTGSGTELVAVIAFENPPLAASASGADDSSPDDISQPGQVKVVTFNPDRQHNYRVSSLDLSEARLSEAGLLLTADARPVAATLAPDRGSAAVALRENGGIVVFDPFWLDTRRIFATKSRPAGVAFSPDGNYLLSAGLPADDEAGGLTVWTLEGDFVWQQIPDGAPARPAGEAPGAATRPAARVLLATARFGSRDYAFVQNAADNGPAVYDIGLPMAPTPVQMLPAAGGASSIAALPGRALLAVAAAAADGIVLFQHSGLQTQ